MLKKKILIVICLLLSACVAAPPKPTVDLPLLQQRASRLPAATLSSTGPLMITYPGEGLFAYGAVLPMPGGPQVLDPLAAILAEFPAVRWSGIVRAASGSGKESDQQLVNKRLELLQTYLSHKGVRAELIHWNVEVAEGPSLELTLEQP